MIRRLFQFLFGWPCEHDWVEVDRQMAKISYPHKPRSFDCMLYAYRCTKCCEFRQHKLGVEP